MILPSGCSFLRKIYFILKYSKNNTINIKNKSDPTDDLNVCFEVLHKIQFLQLLHFFFTLFLNGYLSSFLEISCEQQEK